MNKEKPHVIDSRKKFLIDGNEYCPASESDKAPPHNTSLEWNMNE